MEKMNLYEYIRRTKKKSISQISRATGISRQTIYLFEKGKNQNIKLIAYYLRLNGREIDLKIANLLDNELEAFYREIRGE